MWYVFDTEFTLQGVISEFTETTITHTFHECDTITFHLPFTDADYQTLQEERLLYRYESGKAYIIHTLEIKEDEIWGSGYGLESVFDFRIITYPTTFDKPIESIMHDLALRHVISPTEIWRTIFSFTRKPDLARGGTFSVSYFGESVYQAFCDLSLKGDLGFCVNYHPADRIYEFETYVGTDRTTNQTDVNPVLWMSEWNDTREESVLTSVKDEKNVILVVSGDETPTRITVGDENGTKAGWSRKETFLSASDVNSTMQDESGNVLSQSQINALLQQKGRLELLNHYKTDDFSFTLDEGIPHVFGVDYFVGDKVTVRNQKFNFTKHEVISKVEETIISGKSKYVITFK